MSSLKQIGAQKAFSGTQYRYQHSSVALGCDMVFSLYLPPQSLEQNVPLLIWLSGLTCTDENFVHKAGAQRYAAEFGVAILASDTSPRGDKVPDDPEGAYDFGHGAGFYLNASEAPWSQHYRMYDYICEELPALLGGVAGLDMQRTAISGHSMGGLGALSIAFKNPAAYRSVSAFSPICSVLDSPWGQKAMRQYLGDDKSAWEAYDIVRLVPQVRAQIPVLVDQGDADEFLAEQLNTPALVEAAQAAQYPMRIRMQPGYDHSYYFISSFIGEHLLFHARHLGVENLPV